MQHRDDDLAARALDGDLPADLDADTLTRARGFLRVTAVGRSLTADDHALHEPPTGIWEGIASELTAERAAAGPELPGDPGVVVDLGPRRTVPRFLAAAAATLVVGGAVAAGAWLGSSGDQTEVVAEVALDRLEGQGRGTAELLETGDGTVELALDVADLDELDGASYELWLIDEAVTEPVSLGTIGPEGTITVPVPDDLDVTEFPIVDISVEPDDGDAAHSGKSVLRGTLDLA